MKTKIKKKGATPYKAPMIEVTDVVVEQSILQSGSVQGSPPDAIGEIW